MGRVSAQGRHPHPRGGLTGHAGLFVAVDPPSIVRDMSLRAVHAVIVVLFAVYAAGARAAPASLDSILRADVARGFSGAVLVARGDTVLLDQGYGAVGGAQMRATSRFWIASAGKQFVSAALFKCRGSAGFSLDDPLSKFFPAAPEDKRAITLAQLLAHTSGLDQTYASEGARTREDAVTRMLAKRLVDRPGNKFHYSNDNYELAAAVVEVACGEDYRSYVARALWQPAGLTDTGFNSMPGARDVVPAKEGLPPRLREMARGEAGVYSTAHDLWRWARALRAARVIFQSDTDRLFAPATPIGEGRSALGWFLGKTARGTETIFTRGNEDFGANALVYLYPATDTVIVVLTHAGDANEDTSWSRFVLGELEQALGL